jgi:hypothetical protein
MKRLTYLACSKSDSICAAQQEPNVSDIGQNAGGRALPVAGANVL